MARPSKLTPAQWATIERRLLAGEPARKLAAEFGVTDTAIRKRFGANQPVSLQSSRVRTVAQQLADANLALESLPVAQRQVAINLADELREISSHLAAAARYGAATAHRLSAIAHAQVQQIDDAAPLGESADALKGVAALTRVANEASAIGTTLLRANEASIREDEERARQSQGAIKRIEIVPMASDS